MEGSEIAKRDHQRNKSEIVKLVKEMFSQEKWGDDCLLYTSPSPRDAHESRMPSSA